MPDQPPCFEAEQGLGSVSRTLDLWSSKAGRQWLVLWPPGLSHTFIPCLMPPTTRHSVPSATQCQVFLQLFFSLTRKGGCEQWVHVRNTCPFPALWQLGEEQDHLARRGGGQKSLWTEEQKRWNVKPCAHCGQKQISQEIPWGQSCTKSGRQRAGSLKVFTRKLAFCFLSCTAN